MNTHCFKTARLTIDEITQTLSEEALTLLLKQTVYINARGCKKFASLFSWRKINCRRPRMVHPYEERKSLIYHHTQ